MTSRRHQLRDAAKAQSELAEEARIQGIVAGKRGGLVDDNPH